MTAGKPAERADVELSGRLAPLYRLLRWPARLALANRLWAAGTIAGLGVFGVAPATVAMFWLLREYDRGRQPQAVRGFWMQWRAELGRSQLRLGLPLATVFVHAFYLAAAYQQPGLRPVAGGLAIVLAGYLGTLLPAALVHFDLGATASWRVAAVAAWRQPLLSLAIAVTNAGLLVLMLWAVPAALVFYAASVPGYVGLKAALYAFGKLT